MRPNYFKPMSETTEEIISLTYFNPKEEKARWDKFKEHFYKKVEVATPIIYRTTQSVGVHVKAQWDVYYEADTRTG